VLGPVYGALVLALASWRTIFWLNLAVGLVLAVAARAVVPPLGPPSSPTDAEASAVRPR